jgi:hypothetical protein
MNLDEGKIILILAKVSRVDDTGHCVRRKAVVSAVLKFDVLVQECLLFILVVAFPEGW